MREAEAFADNQCRNLIDYLDGCNYPCPDPQPGRNPHKWYQPYSATGDKEEVRHTVKNGTGLALGAQFPRQVTIQHIAEAA